MESPLLATQIGLVALRARPQAFTTFGSTSFGCWAGSSETWLSWVTRGPGAAPSSSARAGAAPTGTSSATVAPAKPMRRVRFTVIPQSIASAISVDGERAHPGCGSGDPRVTESDFHRVCQVADRAAKWIFHVTESNGPNDSCDLAIGGVAIMWAVAPPVRSVATSDHCIDGHEV